MGHQRQAPASSPYAAYAACPPPTHTKRTKNNTNVAKHTHTVARLDKDTEIRVDIKKWTYHADFSEDLD